MYIPFQRFKSPIKRRRVHMYPSPRRISPIIMANVTPNIKHTEPNSHRVVEFCLILYAINIIIIPATLGKLCFCHLIWAPHPAQAMQVF